MKKILYCLIISCVLFRCTQPIFSPEARATSRQNPVVITLPKNQKLIDINFRYIHGSHDQLWYLTRPMTNQDSCEIYYYNGVISEYFSHQYSITEKNDQSYIIKETR